MPLLRMVKTGNQDYLKTILKEIEEQTKLNNKINDHFTQGKRLTHTAKSSREASLIKQQEKLKAAKAIH